jgi:hypothetical protein
LFSSYFYRGSVLLLLPISLLFFVGGPSAVALPSLRYAWNLGHIAFFFLSTLALYGFRPAWLGRHLLRTGLSIVLISIAIETIQLALGRGFSPIDIARNLSGFSLALVVIYARRVNKPIALAGILFLAADLAVFARTALIDWTQQTQLPIIADFESKLMTGYSHGNFDLSTEEVYTGSAAAMFKLQPARYAGLSLHPVPRDWRNYKNLSLALFNAEKFTYRLTIRINDTIHELSTEQDYYDRYNKNFEIIPGWNEITIPLADISAAPKNREMNLMKMHRIGIFISNLQQPTTVGIDAVKLTH